jgi:hypothetical protein
VEVSKNGDRTEKGSRHRHHRDECGRAGTVNIDGDVTGGLRARAGLRVRSGLVPRLGTGSGRLNPPGDDPSSWSSCHSVGLASTIGS